MSRVRLRLASAFSFAFLSALMALNFVSYEYVTRGADSRITAHLVASVDGLRDLIDREYAETPDRGVAFAAYEALSEWPSGDETFGVYDGDGALVYVRGDSAWLSSLGMSRLPSDLAGVVDLPIDETPGARVAVARKTSPPPWSVLGVASTEAVFAESRALLRWLVVSSPLLLMTSLIAGYLLSKRALRPIRALGQAMESIGPGDLSRRLPTQTPPDEIDALAAQFNALMERLSRAKSQNERFLQQVAHQLKTPLTVVLGESALALERTSSDHRSALERVRRAAEQMQRRVRELEILARAETGDPIGLSDRVELDGLVLECADMMRVRAHSLGCRLELARIEPVLVSGNQPLLREAVMEMIENACRHGDARVPVQISTLSDGGVARVEVANGAQPPADDTASEAANAGPGIGLSILRWIAAVHGGTLHQRAMDGLKVYALEIPRAGGRSDNADTLGQEDGS